MTKINDTNEFVYNQHHLQENERYLKICLQNFEIFYKNEQLTEAIEQLWIAMSLFEFCHDEVIKEQLLYACVRVIVYFKNIPQFEMLLENIVAHESVKSAPKILSMCFFCLSHLTIERQKLQLAMNYAKLSYFYAQKIEDEKARYFHQCNAQLQLVCVTMEAGHIEEVAYFIQKFGWYIENCKNNQEQILVTAIEITFDVLKNKTISDVAKFRDLLQRFIQSREQLYTSYLALYFKRILKLYTPLQIETEQLLTLCDEIGGRLYSGVMQLEMMPEHYYVQSNAFFKAALEVCQNNHAWNQGTYIAKVVIDEKALARFLELLLVFKQTKEPLATHSYAPNQYVIITSQTGEQMLASFLHAQPAVQLLGFILTNDKTNFFDLYNTLNLKLLQNTR